MKQKTELGTDRGMDIAFNESITRELEVIRLTERLRMHETEASALYNELKCSAPGSKEARRYGMRLELAEHRIAKLTARLAPLVN